MLPAINIGPLVIPTAAFIYIIGAWLSINLVEYTGRKLNLDPHPLSNLVTTGLITGIIGARLTFVALYWSAYQDNLLGIVWPINAGFNVWGGLITGALGMFFYGRFKQLEPAPTLDALAPALVLGLITISLADFLGGPGFGTATDLPWGIRNFGISRHPVQLYEIIVGLLALLAWRIVYRRHRFEGQLFLMTTAVYCFGRLFVDAFRADPWITSEGWHILQIICLVIVLLCLFLLQRNATSEEIAQG